MKKSYIYIFFCLVIIIACTTLITNKQTIQTTHTNSATTSLKFNFQNFKPSNGSNVYNKTYYSLEYNEEHEQPNWVYYLLTADFVNGSAKRKDKFKADTEISTKSAALSDYKKSGYDRGHLCPAADMKLNDLAMKETFLLSNMSPQLPGLNRGEWKRLESQVRKWAVQEDSLIVITGPIFKNNLGKIGNNQVTIPGAYYKVIYDITEPQKMTAFILPHTKKLAPFITYQTSVDEVEQQTGIDFFAILADEKEVALEQNKDW